MKALGIVVFLLAHVASAGPYCGGEAVLSPPTRETLPVRPRLVFAEQDRFKADHQFANTVPKIAATIDGTTVKLRIDNQRAGRYTLYIIDVQSDREGTLVVTAPNATGTYTIDHAWQRPTLTTDIANYHETMQIMTNKQGYGVRVGVTGQVIAFEGRWRRDKDASWQPFKMPAVVRDQEPSLRFGEIPCGPPNVPSSWLDKGIEVEATAWLTDRSRMKLTDVPAAVVRKNVPTSASE